MAWSAHCRGSTCDFRGSSERQTCHCGFEFQQECVMTSEHPLRRHRTLLAQSNGSRLLPRARKHESCLDGPDVFFPRLTGSPPWRFEAGSLHQSRVRTGRRVLRRHRHDQHRLLFCEALRHAEHHPESPHALDASSSERSCSHPKDCRTRRENSGIEPMSLAIN